MKKNICRKVMVGFSVCVVLLLFGWVVNAATFNDTVSFGANANGYSTVAHQVDITNPTGFKTKIVGFTLNGMPSGTVPSNSTRFYFRLYKGINHSIVATNKTTHSRQDYIDGKWYKATFKSGINPSVGQYFVVESDSNSSLGATVGVQWKYY